MSPGATSTSLWNISRTGDSTLPCSNTEPFSWTSTANFSIRGDVGGEMCDPWGSRSKKRQFLTLQGRQSGAGWKWWDFLLLLGQTCSSAASSHPNLPHFHSTAALSDQSWSYFFTQSCYYSAQRSLSLPEGVWMLLAFPLLSFFFGGLWVFVVFSLCLFYFQITHSNTWLHFSNVKNFFCP